MRAFTALAVPVVVAALAGCAPNLQALSAPQIGCAESAIQVVETGADSWQATCGGQSYTCNKTTAPNSAAQASAVASISGTPNTSLQTAALVQALDPTVAVACAPLGGRAVAPAPPPPPPPQSGAVSRQREEGGRTVLRLSLTEAPFTFGFEWSDASSATVRSTWIAPAKMGAASRESCAVSLVVDGAPVALPAPKYQAVPAREILRLDIPVAALEKISAAKNASARVCDEQLVFSDRSRAALGELVVQIHGTPQKP